MNPSGLLHASLPLLSPGGRLVTLVHDLETLTSDLGVVVGCAVWMAKWLKTHMIQVSAVFMHHLLTDMLSVFG